MNLNFDTFQPRPLPSPLLAGGPSPAPAPGEKPPARAPATLPVRLGREEAPESRWGAGVLVALVVHGVALATALTVSTEREAAKAAVESTPTLVFFAPRAPAAVAAAPTVAPATRPAAPRAAQRKALVAPRAVPPPVVAAAPKAPEPAETEAVPSEAQVEVSAAATAPAAVAAGGAGVGTVVGDGRPGAAFGSGDGAVEVGQLAQAPRLRTQIAPRFSREAHARHVEGTVVVRIIVDAQGRVEADQSRIVRSVPELDAAVLSAVSRWTFTPGIGRDGRPVRVYLTIPFKFSLR